MKVYKFGGASVKDAHGVRNLREIVAQASDDLMVVISAMGRLDLRVLQFFQKQQPYLTDQIACLQFYIRLALQPGKLIDFLQKLLLDLRFTADRQHI